MTYGSVVFINFNILFISAIGISVKSHIGATLVRTRIIKNLKSGIATKSKETRNKILAQENNKV